MKTITICGKEYPIDCNAYTTVEYENFFNRDILEDIQIINQFYLKQTILTKSLLEKNKKINDEELIKQLSASMMTDVGKYRDAVTRIAYICIYTANENIESYKDWMKSIPRLKTNDDWIVEVTELAVDCFC